MTPGVLYDREHYNCSHVVADYYRERLGLTVPATDADNWQPAMTLWMRRRFRPIRRPEQDCLVVVRNRAGSLHVGVWDDGLMLHGHNDGQVIRSPLSMIRGDISFWRYHGHN